MPRPAAEDFRTAGCGLLMGAADIVPGVSGGTVALVLGIYNRLVVAISHVNREFVSLVLQRRWREAARHIDLRFLIALATGIGTAAMLLSSLLSYLLTSHRQYTFGAFFGLILGSGILVARHLETWSRRRVVALVIATVATWFLVGLRALQQPPEGLLYLFFCGVIGISAMILPGISGSFILLLLGRYDRLIEIIEDLTHGNWTIQTIAAAGTFGAGCVSGLLIFSRLLRWLLDRYRDVTLATLCGVMIGSLRRIWPFKVDLDPDIEKISRKRFENVLPDSFDSTVMLTLGFIVAGLAVVLAIDARARHRSRSAASAS